MLSEKFLMDYERLTGEKYSFLKGGGAKLLTTLGLRFMFWGRVSENCHNRFTSFIVKIIMHHYKEKHNLMLPFGRTGGGLALGYPHDIIVNGGVEIGEYACLYKGVLIGSIKGGTKGGVPRIGNHVVIAQNATVVGNITIGNDAKCAANAEIGYGNLRDIQDGAVVILGTGIGGCLIKNHQVHTGRHFSAGEFSFIKTDYHDYNGWNHAWSTRTGIQGLLERVQESLGTDEYYTGIEIFDMANQGNEKVIAGIDQFAREVATQIFNVHIIFDCEKVAIGGGISAQPLLIELIQKNFDDIFNHLGFDVYHPEIVPCYFRNDANLIGALYQHLLTYK